MTNEKLNKVKTSLIKSKLAIGDKMKLNNFISNTINTRKNQSSNYATQKDSSLGLEEQFQELELEEEFNKLEASLEDFQADLNENKELRFELAEAYAQAPEAFTELNTEDQLLIIETLALLSLGSLEIDNGLTEIENQANALEYHAILNPIAN